MNTKVDEITVSYKFLKLTAIKITKSRNIGFLVDLLNILL